MDSCCCLVCVRQSNVGMLEEMGKFSTVIPPGMQCINCCTNSVKGVQTLKLQQATCRVSGQTSERMTLTVHVEIMYRAIPSMAHTAYYSMKHPEEQLTSFVENSLRGELSNHTFERLVLSKEEIANKVQAELEERLESLGFEVVDLLLIDFTPAADVIKAMEQQVIQRYNREANSTAADIRRIESIIAAEAAAEAKRLSGVGAAEMQKGLSQGIGTALQLWDAGDKSASVMAMVLMEHYFGMMEQIVKASSSRAVFSAGLIGQGGGGSTLTHRLV
jgi:regulator of protease activity HflC (stomatin/prohibitin superfamily)